MPWFAANMYFPVGSIPKYRGIFPCVGTYSRGVSVNWRGSIENTAMLSCPRFDPYSTVPARFTCTSAAVLFPLKSAGSVETVWISFSVPPPAAYSKVVMLDAISLMQYTILPFGWNAR